MSTHDSIPQAPAGPKRVKPHQLALGFGIFMGLFTLISGIIPLITEWHDDSPIQRAVFTSVPGPIQAAFYTVVPVMLIWGAWAFSLRMRNWERGAPDRRKTTAKNAKKRLADFRAGVYMQTLLRDSAAGLMHSLIYFGFLVLLAVTTVSEIDHQMPEDLKFLHGRTYQGYALVGDVGGIVFLAGIIWAIVRRYVQRPYRIRIKTKPEHAVILGTFLLIGVSGFVAEALRIAEQTSAGQDMGFEQWSIVGYPMSQWFDGASATTLDTWHQVWWLVHVVGFLVFLALLPVTMLRHVFTSPLNMYLKDKERPKGAMKPMPNLTETSLESFGASVVEDFTWKQLLDTDACTMCGRCTAVCPAHATGKPLDPREIVLKTGEVMAATAAHGHVSPPIGVDSEITIGANSLFERITPEEIWACTSCKACDEVCPVNIEILDKILDMRRYLSLMESNFPAELGNAYRSMENQGNPWGMNQGDRADWAKGLDVTVVDPGEAFDPRVPLLGRLRRVVRRQEQEGHPGDGQAAPPRRAGRGDPRAVGDVHRRPRPPLGQRVPVPDAGDAEHRDARRHGGAQDHHPVPALLQHAEERVPPARRELRGRPPLPAARAADRVRQARRFLGDAGGAGRPTTTRATSVATTTSTSLHAR